MATARDIDMAVKGWSRPVGKETWTRLEHLVTRYDGPDGASLYGPDARRVIAACAAITGDRATVIDVAAALGVPLGAA